MANEVLKLEGQAIISDKALTVGTELVTNIVDAAFKEHIPVITEDDE